ncbi:MAG: argininosuccinate lyase [Gemmatimonadetes bacterium]|nr:argininosuccinate lyase [Gemmatimonadota bacterium]
MWGGRFSAAPEESFSQLNRSLPVDHRLWPQDIRGSKAWVRALAQAGILAPGEDQTLRDGLDRVARRLADGAGTGAPDEDVHTLVERLLYEEIGDLAGKLHTGRSRNDQVATDLRLWCLTALEQVDRELAGLGAALVAQAEKGMDLILPGYTHGQQAQPVRWAYVLLAHAWPLVRDRERLADAARRTAVLPLGSGALAGSGVPVDRDLLREELGFRAISPNALDATGERDFVVEIVFALALLLMHVSRLAGELVTYSSTEFGFVRLADGYCTGSSLMPQKRNPDVFELARVKVARTLGDLVGLLTALKGLPAGYSKDLQEDKAFLFDAVDTVLLTLPAVRGGVATMEPVAERMNAALQRGLLATDLADGLVAQGVPFREAHVLVGRLVQEAERLRVDLAAVPPEAARAIHGSLPALLASLGSFAESVERRATPGGSARASVLAQLSELAAAFRA